jgi:predicted phosphodiesterase
MTHNDSLPDLSTTKLIGLLGDTHGDLEHLLIVSQTMWKRGVSVLVVLGDFGVIWPGHNWDNDLDKVSKRLTQRGQVLYWLDGNHEAFTTLYSKFPVAEDGLRQLRPNVIHLPRGYRTPLTFGRTLAVLGGANSIDAHHRELGSTWWLEEQITDDDLEKLGHEHAEVMLGHDAPTPLPGLDESLAKTDHFWPQEMLAYAAAGRQKFTEGFLQVRPSLYFGGHYHQYIDETVAYGEAAAAFETRVILLGMNSSSTLSQAVLNLQNLKVEAFTRNDTTVTRLTGVESGLWRVRTRDSTHLFDLDAETVERRPGPNALLPNIKDLRSLRSISVCEIGERGFWTFPSDGVSVDYLWTNSSTVERIERLQPEERTTPTNAGQTKAGDDD